ncbi:MAG: succinate dehydrogenase, cytochrome b556 subunit [Pseudomonadota bacterium]
MAAGNADLKPRPLSPHLQIYKPQITSVLSIMHRGTGIVLAVGTLVLVYWLASAAAGPDYFTTASAIVGSWFGLLCLFGWTAALFYHLCNGIRHLVWDAGYGYELETVSKSGWAVLIATGILTVLSWTAGLII